MKKIITILILAIATVSNAFTIEPLGIEAHNCRVYGISIVCNSNTEGVKLNHDNKKYKIYFNVDLECESPLIWMSYDEGFSTFDVSIYEDRIVIFEEDTQSKISLGKKTYRISTNLSKLARTIVNETHNH